MKKKQVTTNDILGVKKGESVEWALPTPRAARNAQAMVNYVKNFCIHPEVEDYKTKRIDNKIIIQAI